MVNNKQPWFIRLKCDMLDSLEMGKNKCVFINSPGPLTLHGRWFHLIKQVYAFTSRTIHFSFECQVQLDLSSLMYQWTMLNLNQTDSIEQISSLLLWSLNSRGIVFFGLGLNQWNFVFLTFCSVLEYNKTLNQQWNKIELGFCFAYDLLFHSN